ncbi:zinc finger protein ZAT9-like [Punica granatum]|uniref:C2H2-type domain-containing protein n=2 Tax=Punica granatum TaxID=22663 RepID=A0A218X3G8_PUNGR|nr:zinc finger protein ZAT9-like [Punica granatum]OWM79444.1 hypothetical protein CDL15_Pgr022856 [Punica granatum]PKI39245.1 hypothetical protein CRG98_040374 [Punica granatum]
MEANTRVCKICDRSFANGKAMGGHMRSHLAKFQLPPAPKPQPEPSQSPATVQSANSELSSIAISDPTVHDDRESDTESRKIIMNPDKTTGLQLKRSKRGRRLASYKPMPVDAPEYVSSESTSQLALSDEEVARCLLLLSIGNSSRGPIAKKEPKEAVDETELSEEEEEEKGESFCAKWKQTRATRSKFKCKVCKKIFRSYQALGGHRASHGHGTTSAKDTRRINHQRDSNNKKADQRDPDRESNNRKIFKCPFCDKVFESGQGLGGHKKVHAFDAAKKKIKISNSDCDDTTAQKLCRRERLFFDLNLPAATEDEVISQPQLAKSSSG